MLNVYLFLGVVGVGWTVVSLALGKVFGGDSHGADASADAGGEPGIGEGLGESGELHLPLFSPTAIAGYLTGFGATGMILMEGVGLQDPYLHVPGALAGAAAVGLGTAYATLRLMRAGETSSEARVATLVGRTGELTVGVPEGGLGEIAYLAGGGRSSAAARSTDGAAIPRGTGVRIVRIEGSTFVVAPAGKLPLPQPIEAGSAAAPPREKQRE